MLPFLGTNRTLRGQLVLIIVTSTIAMLLMGGLSIWRIRQFNQRDSELRQATLALRDNLKNNFTNTRLLGEIDSELRLYMRSGNRIALENILIDINTLLGSLESDKRRVLIQFKDKLHILQIRMDSLRENDEKIFKIEREIVHTTNELFQRADSKLIVSIQKIISEAILKHHHLYNTTLLTTETENLQRAIQEYDELFDNLENRLKAIEADLPEVQQAVVQSLLEHYYELDETVSTINSIRKVTLETKTDIEQMIVDIKANIASGSIAQAEASSVTMVSVLELARNNLVFMSVTLVVTAFLLVLVAFFLNQSMVKPLLNFSSTLEKMTRMLTGIRMQNEFENDSPELLSSLTTGNRQNEIGRVALAIENLLNQLRNLAIFRQTVEADETKEEIYQRLARTFTEKLDLQNFIFFELLENKTEMTPFMRHVDEGFHELPETTLNEDCRSRRTNTVVSSLSDPHTCTLFPANDHYRHVCIPMQVSGNMIGVVQFLFPPDLNEETLKDLKQKLIEARQYIAEALPVLHAKRLAERLKIMATEDQLTGLFNRYYLENTLDRLIAGIRRRNSTICTLMCDLDHFKDVNDTYGHDAGDKVLIQLAKILQSTVRDSDLVVRFGGEEFMILLVDCEPDTSQEMAERIRREVQLYKFHIPGYTIRMTVSIGFSIFPDSPDQDIWDSFKLADIALYRAKEEGRNRVVRFNRNLLVKTAGPAKKKGTGTLEPENSLTEKSRKDIQNT